MPVLVALVPADCNQRASESCDPPKLEMLTVPSGLTSRFVGAFFVEVCLLEISLRGAMGAERRRWTK